MMVHKLPTTLPCGLQEIDYNHRVHPTGYIFIMLWVCTALQVINNTKHAPQIAPHASAHTMKEVVFYIGHDFPFHSNVMLYEVD